MYKFKLLISVFALAGVFSACNQGSDTADSSETDSLSKSASLPVSIKDSATDEVFNHYIDLKDALVASNTSQSQAAAKVLANALNKIDGCQNTAVMANNIANTSDLKVQRFNFTALSSDIIAMLKHTEIVSGSMFVQYCPMANDGDGGYWLASETEIRNPYYGEQMVNCGEVKDTLKKK